MAFQQARIQGRCAVGETRGEERDCRLRAPDSQGARELELPVVVDVFNEGVDLSPEN